MSERQGASGLPVVCKKRFHNLRQVVVWQLLVLTKRFFSHTEECYESVSLKYLHPVNLLEDMFLF
nr:TPA_asm: Agno [Cat associated lyon-IARC polyomavirus]